MLVVVDVVFVVVERVDQSSLNNAGAKEREEEGKERKKPQVVQNAGLYSPSEPGSHGLHAGVDPPDYVRSPVALLQSYPGVWGTKRIHGLGV